MTNAPRIDAIEEVTEDLQEVLSVTTEATLIPQYMTPTTVTGTPAAGQFYSAISGRAPMLDLSKIPSGKFGIERIMFLGNNPVITGESGSSGETVYDSPDSLGRMRSVGQWGFESSGSNGPGDWGTSTLGSSIEITFYGTALNMVAFQNPFNRTYDVFVDGVAAPGISVTGSVVISDRNYGPHIIYPVVSGLTLGVHTVTIVDTSGNGRLYGFEILNDSVDVTVPEGSLTSGAKKINILSTTDDLTTFANEYQDGSGTITDATKGGHIVRYTSDAGVISKDINYTDSAQGTIGGSDVDHSNEEVVNIYHARQFKAVGRSDDFSQQTSPVNASFTLDDGVTSLSTANANLTGSLTPFGGFGPNNGGYLDFTFIGTGLDIEVDTFGGTLAAPITISIDGNTISGGSVNSGTLFGTEDGFKELVSGLPFGTHRLRIFNDAGGTSPFYSRFKVYGPAKPTIPAGAIEIDSTYKVADYVATAATGGVSTGVIRKMQIREHSYSGTWTVLSENDSSRIGAKDLRTNTASSTVSYTFFGTGFDIRFHQETAPNNTITVDGSSDLSGFTTTTFGGPSLNPATGVLTVDGFLNVGVTVAGMLLGFHTVTVTNNSGTYIHGSFDIHTPTYNYSNNVLNTSDALVGSNSIKNEILIPGATKTKTIFTEDVDLGPNKTKWQRKVLSSNVTSAGILDDLGFSGLTIGNTYKLSGFFMFHVIPGSGSAIHIDIKDGASTLQRAVYMVNNDSDESKSLSFSHIFTAATAQVFLDVVTWAGGGEISGGLANNITHTILEELPNHVETNEW
jgi:hypothetical protein